MAKKSETSENFDARLARVQEIAAMLEGGDLPFERGLALYKEGMALSKICREQLERARNEITLCAEDGLHPFDPESAAQEEDGNV